MSDNKPLHQVVALVTGASRGAGKGIACALGAEGATVLEMVEGLSPEDLSRLAGVPLRFHSQSDAA